MLKIEVINISLAVIIIACLIYAIYKSYSNKDSNPKEYFRRSNMNKCDALTNQYCQNMKTNNYNNLQTGNGGLLYKIQQECGDDYYMKTQNCYPSWATTKGGLHDAVLYPELDDRYLYRK